MNKQHILLGYACINEHLKQQNVRCNRTKRLSHWNKRKSINELIDISRQNFRDLKKILLWNVRRNIKCFRISSNITPLRVDLNNNTYRYGIDTFQQELQDIKRIIETHKLFVSFHMMPYVILNSHKKCVVKNSILDIKNHYEILNAIANETNSWIVVHVGGVYNDKQLAIRRFVDNYATLNDGIKKILHIENCERFSFNDCLRIKTNTNSHLIFDVFHEICYNKINRINVSDDAYKRIVQQMIAFKKPHGKIPIFHFSQQHKQKRRIGAHSMCINALHDDLLNANDTMIVMLECKNKEQSVLKLQKKYNEFVVQ